MRIFLSPLVAGTTTVHGDEHHYVSRVRRARVGDRLEIVDGDGKRAAAEIVSITETETQLRVDSVENVPNELPCVRALIPVIKGDRMDSCVEKLVEVGVDAIVVWPAARGIVKLEGDRRAGRLEHYQSIAQAAARQSGRATVPTVGWADSLASAIAALPAGGFRIVLDPGADASAPLGPEVEDVTIASGPEGGLAAAELDLLTASLFHGLGLGPRILRAETAPVVAVALVRASGRG